jgi:hypothetical protein
MSTNTYFLPGVVQCSATFQIAGSDADPDGVVFKVRVPNTALATVYVYGTDDEVVKDATGKYHVDVIPTQRGTYYYRFEGSGDSPAAMEGSFHVDVSHV